jgi:hypothetical protein
MPSTLSTGCSRRGCRRLEHLLPSFRCYAEAENSNVPQLREYTELRVIFNRRARSPLTAAYPQIASVPGEC